MRNITLAVEEEVLNKVRSFAAERRTSISALVRDHLAAIIARDKELSAARKKLARKKLLALMDNSKRDK